jgi:putative ABC transport system ATP-binding protein
VSGPVVECDNLVRIHRRGSGASMVEVVALQGLDLQVDAGELVAVVGASGSGKSSLLTILSGLDRPTAGRVRVAGHDLLHMSRRERVHYQRHVVGFVWQQSERNLLPYLTAEQNVAVPMTLARAPAAQRRRRVGELLDLLGVAAVAARRPGELSGGQQQRVAIAAALANGPELLLADEPTGALDSATAEDVLVALHEVNAVLGTTVVVVTHDQAVAASAPRTVSIRDGRTSTEVRRYRVTEGDGTIHEVHEEVALLDRTGRLQLPADHVAALGLEERVRLVLTDDHVELWPDDRGPAPRG